MRCSRDGGGVGSDDGCGVGDAAISMIFPFYLRIDVVYFKYISVGLSGVM